MESIWDKLVQSEREQKLSAVPKLSSNGKASAGGCQFQCPVTSSAGLRSTVEPFMEWEPSGIQFSRAGNGWFCVKL